MLSFIKRLFTRKKKLDGRVLGTYIRMSKKYLVGKTFEVNENIKLYEFYKFSFVVKEVCIKDERICFTVVITEGAVMTDKYNVFIYGIHTLPAVEKYIISILGKYFGFTPENTFIEFKYLY